VDVQNVEVGAPQQIDGGYLVVLRNAGVRSREKMPIAMLRARGKAINGRLYPGIPTSPDVLNSMIRGDEGFPFPTKLNEIKLEFGQRQGILQSFASEL
jgi:hypothetical protein